MIDDIKVRFTDTGIQVPTADEVLSEIQAQWRIVFPDINLDPSTPQGLLMTMITELVVSQNNAIMYLANQFNPLTASGQWQDAMAKIYFIERKGAQATQVTVKCTGLDGIVIPAGSQIQDANGNIYTSIDAGTITQGTCEISFYNTKTGAIECPVHAINTSDGIGTIRTVIQGWDTAENETAGIVGRDVESQQEFEARRYDSVAGNSMSLDGSILSKILSIPDVIDAKILDNRTDSTAIIQGVSLMPHSVAIYVLGGNDAQIADAIYRSISCGCNMNGDVTVNVTDEITGAINPITFSRPDTVRLYVKINLIVLPTTKSNYQELIRTAILEKMSTIRIGETVYSNALYEGVLATGTLGIKTIELSTDGTSYSTVITPNGNEILAVSSTDIIFDEDA